MNERTSQSSPFAFAVGQVWADRTGHEQTIVAIDVDGDAPIVVRYCDGNVGVGSRYTLEGKPSFYEDCVDGAEPGDDDAEFARDCCLVRLVSEAVPTFGVTAGPWSEEHFDADDHTNIMSDFYDGSDRRDEYINGGWDIACFFGPDRKANARLACNAKPLLAKLKQARSYLDGLEIAAEIDSLIAVAEGRGEQADPSLGCRS